jgi:microcin C transport system permease protein
MTPPKTLFSLYYGAFRRNRLALWSGRLLCVLILLSLGANLIANDKPLVMQHQGRVMFPLVVSYTDGQGFPESVTSTAGSVPLVNDGAAAFAIMGTPAVGQTLTAERSADDPDGNGADPIFSWQASSDGSTWSTIASNSFSYTVSDAYGLSSTATATLPMT